MKKVQLKKKDLEVINRILGESTPWILFGSRINFTAGLFSDLDICCYGEPQPSGVEMEVWREALEESDLPIVVDLSRFCDLPEFLKTSVKNEGILLSQSVGVD